MHGEGGYFEEAGDDVPPLTRCNTHELITPKKKRENMEIKSDASPSNRPNVKFEPSHSNDITLHSVKRSEKGALIVQNIAVPRWNLLASERNGAVLGKEHSSNYKDINNTPNRYSGKGICLTPVLTPSRHLNWVQ